MKQSSIEWLIDTMHRSAGLDQNQIDTIFEQAKSMHKDEQIDSIINGMYEGQKMYFSEHKIKLDDNSLNFCIALAEHYYNETFNTK